MRSGDLQQLSLLLGRCPAQALEDGMADVAASRQPILHQARTTLTTEPLARALTLTLTLTSLPSPSHAP